MAKVLSTYDDLVLDKFWMTQDNKNITFTAFI